MRFLLVLAVASIASFASASPVKKLKAGTPIPNQYIVVFKDHIDALAIASHEQWLTSMFITAPLLLQDQDSDEDGRVDALPIVGGSNLFPDFGFIHKYFVDGMKGYAARIPDIVAKSLLSPILPAVRVSWVAEVLDLCQRQLTLTCHLFGICWVSSSLTMIQQPYVGFCVISVCEKGAISVEDEKLPEIAFIEQDQIMTIMDYDYQDNPPSWGLKRIGSRTLPLPKNYTYPDSAGEGVDAYIVDTGCTIAHPDFEGRAVVGASFSTDKNDKDGNGHGTHVAGTVAGAKFGVAKKAKIVAVKVLNSQGSGTNSDVIAGVEWVATNAPKRSKKAVANMSLGGGASAALDKAVKAAVEAGVPFAVAAGNSAGDACKLSPARVKEAVTVAASDSKDKLASFSERGACVDIIAPGVDITSTWNNGKENTISGTSMASPHVCGVLALAMGEKEFPNPKAVKDFIIGIGTRAAVTGVPKNTVNVLLYADVTAEPQPADPNEPEKPEPGEPDEPEEPEEGVCPFPQCLFDPSCTSCCFEGVDC
ncbi:hypothetical protein HDU76_000070 [Blyttiomyces sp. JEL0837]|nr:hypothetical protein HDU76_000070 [Blyttiomyces sp. JEL0837]